MGNISRRHHWFHRKMMSAKWVQKFHTDDMSIPRSGSAFWLVEANFQTIRPTTQIWVVKGHQYGIFVPRLHFAGKPVVAWWLMSAVFSGCYKKGWKWLHQCIFNSQPPSFLCTVEPCLMATSVTWSPRYYGHFFFRGLFISL